MDKFNIITIISVLAIVFLFVVYLVTNSTSLGYTGMQNLEMSEPAGINEPFGISSACEYLGLAELTKLGIAAESKGITLSANDVCKRLATKGYSKCFAGEYSNIQTYFSSNDGTCMGSTQMIGRDIFMEECDIRPMGAVCKTNTKTSSEPYLGDFNDERYLVAAICCKK
ncbi:hypothetical protein J4436_01290 [Candidatus Woesearchaeota archaeon]|nr:hypothetical protein [Candidatus Woesearchaeota archaeon]